MGYSEKTVYALEEEAQERGWILEDGEFSVYTYGLKLKWIATRRSNRPWQFNKLLPNVCNLTLMLRN